MIKKIKIMNYRYVEIHNPYWKSILEKEPISNLLTTVQVVDTEFYIN